CELHRRQPYDSQNAWSLRRSMPSQLARVDFEPCTARRRRAMSHNRMFTRFTEWAARASGHPISTLLAFTVIVLWACTGPLFHYSDTWQLVINTVTTLVTFVMVFLIQSSQNREGEALQ